MNLFSEEMVGGNRDPQAWMDGFLAIRSRTAMGPIEAECTEINDEHLTIEFDITDRARQPLGLLHGGISMLIAETAASYHAAWLCDLQKVGPVGIDINGTHVGGAKDGRVSVRASLIRKASTFVFHEVEVKHLDTGHVLSKARVTNFLKPHN